MSDEEFFLTGRGALFGLGIGLLVMVIGAVYLLLGLGTDIAFPCLAAVFGGLGAIISLRVMVEEPGTVKAMRTFWPIRKIVVSGSGIALHRKDHRVASEIAWHEVVDVQYADLQRKVWGREVSREPGFLWFWLAGGRTFEIPLFAILSSEDRPKMVQAVATHLAAAGYTPKEVRRLLGSHR